MEWEIYLNFYDVTIWDPIQREVRNTLILCVHAIEKNTKMVNMQIHDLLHEPINRNLWPGRVW